MSIIPNEKQLKQLYELFFSKTIKPNDVVRASQWARYDPRLGEILISYLEQSFDAFNPIELNNALLKQAWPASLAVLLEQVCVQPEKRKRFESWKNCVLYNVKPLPLQLFFINRPLGSKSAFEDAKQSLKPFLKWGFLSRHSLRRSNFKTYMDKAKRRMLLDAYLMKNKSISIRLYRKILNDCVSVRQAQRDLKENGLLKAKHFTRARKYVLQDA